MPNSTTTTTHSMSVNSDSELDKWITEQAEEYDGNKSKALREICRREMQRDTTEIREVREIERKHVQRAYETLANVDVDSPSAEIVVALDDAQEHLGEVLGE